MRVVEPATATDLDGSPNFEFLDSFHPLIPRLDAFHRSDHIAISIDNVHYNIRCGFVNGVLVAVMLNTFHALFMGSRLIGSHLDGIIGDLSPRNISIDV
jgi:hypothetical protein